MGDSKSTGSAQGHTDYSVRETPQGMENQKKEKLEGRGERGEEWSHED